MIGLAIITINLNNANGLRETIKSVAHQKKLPCVPPIQYIVIDGCSSDDSLDICNEFKNSIDILISEKDRGIYDAMNKGIDLCTMDKMLFLNSGDYFVGNVLDAAFTVGSIFPVKRHAGSELIDIKRKNPNFFMPYCHQGIVFQASDLRYNTNIKLNADYLYVLESNIHKYFNPIDCKGFVYFDTTGISSRHAFKRDLDGLKVHYLYFGASRAFLMLFVILLKQIARGIKKMYNYLYGS